MKTDVTVNENGMRVGFDHHKAVLTDIEVEALIQDRGAVGMPSMSYRELAIKYGVSKSSVRDILIGRRRAQFRMVVEKDIPTVRNKQNRVRMNLRVSPRARVILHLLGGGHFVNELLAVVDAQLRRAPEMNPKDALERVLARMKAGAKTKGKSRAHA